MGQPILGIKCCFYSRSYSSLRKSELRQSSSLRKAPPQQRRTPRKLKQKFSLWYFCENFRFSQQNVAKSCENYDNFIWKLWKKVVRCLKLSFCNLGKKINYFRNVFVTKSKSLREKRKRKLFVSTLTQREHPHFFAPPARAISRSSGVLPRKIAKSTTFVLKKYCISRRGCT
jgi:hypothetical protein